MNLKRIFKIWLYAVFVLILFLIIVSAYAIYSVISAC